MDVKYCKNCANFTPIFSKEALEPHEDYSFGYCRVISKIEIVDNHLVLSQKPGTIERVVAVNQPIIVNQEKICPGYTNLSDFFHPENLNLQISNIGVLRNLNYVKCKNCFHLFAAPEEQILSENHYMCPICFSGNEYAREDHFKRDPEFVMARYR